MKSSHSARIPRRNAFDLTIKAFNFSEQYRVPVFVMMDECVGHMTEKVVIPRAEDIEVEPRHWTSKDKSTFKLFEPVGDTLVPEMAKAGDGYNIHVTGLTHDERGYPNLTLPVQDRTIRRMVRKIRDNADKICLTEQHDIEGADVVVVSYGITSRVAQRAVETARAAGPQGWQFALDHGVAFP